MKTNEIIVMHSLEDINETVQKFESLLNELSVSCKDICAVKLCLQEALLNGFIHGNNYDKDKDLTLKYSFNKKNNSVEINIKDEGDGFDISKLPDPTKEENLLLEHGRGVFIIREYMDSIKYNKKGNSVTFKKKFE